MDWKTIVVLAKSYKNNNWCIAGRELIKGADNKYMLHHWIRPTSSETHGAISSAQCTLDNGREAQVLDIVKIPIDAHDPLPAQPENYRIGDNNWHYVQPFPPNYVKACSEKPNDIWMESEENSDWVSPASEKHITQSLYLVKPEQFIVTLTHEFDEYKQEFKKAVKASFNYDGKAYKGLSITDPKVRRMLKNRYPERGGTPNSITLLKGDDYHLCVSLGPQFGAEKKHYKFVAAVFDQDGYLQRTY